MDVTSPSSPATSPLAAVTQRAGAVLTTCGRASVAAHYGSAAAELGVCVTAVGIADRSDLGKLRIAGRADAIAELLRHVTGVPLASSGVATAAGAWWCAVSPEHVIVLCEPGRAHALLGVLRTHARRLPCVEVSDMSSSHSAIALVGPRASRVLSTLGALGTSGDPRVTAPFGRAMIGGVDVQVLLQSDRRAIVLTDPPAADRVWRAIAEAGRADGLSCVGTEAVERFALLDRLRVPSAPSR